MPQRPPRKLVRLVLALRAVWLLPLTVFAALYAGNATWYLFKLMFYRSAWREFVQALFAAALGAAFLLLTWRIWRKTWDMVLDRIYPERSAVRWQIMWIVLLLLLPYFLIWPHAKALWRYSAEGANKGNLALLRSAVGDYKAATGAYPPDLEILAERGFIKEVPLLWDGRFAGFEHRPSSATAVYARAAPQDSGRWAYAAVKGAAPLVFIDCTHKDSRGIPWSAY
jgi:hypothetical protein